MGYLEKSLDKRPTKEDMAQTGGRVYQPRRDDRWEILAVGRRVTPKKDKQGAEQDDNLVP